MNEIDKKLRQEPIEAYDDEPTPEQREMALYEGAVETFGAKAQILMAIEEMSELTKALLKYIRYMEFGHGSEGDVLAVISDGLLAGGLAIRAEDLTGTAICAMHATIYIERITCVHI